MYFKTASHVSCYINTLSTDFIETICARQQLSSFCIVSKVVEIGDFLETIFVHEKRGPNGDFTVIFSYRKSKDKKISESGCESR